MVVCAWRVCVRSAKWNLEGHASRRAFFVASRPDRVRRARHFSTSPAMASNAAVTSKGRPSKSMSRPEQITVCLRCNHPRTRSGKFPSECGCRATRSCRAKHSIYQPPQQLSQTIPAILSAPILTVRWPMQDAVLARPGTCPGVRTQSNHIRI